MISFFLFPDLESLEDLISVCALFVFRSIREFPFIFVISIVIISISIIMIMYLYPLFVFCGCKILIMATTACFIIVSRNDIPIYEAEVGVAAKVCFSLFYFSFCEFQAFVDL